MYIVLRCIYDTIWYSVLLGIIYLIIQALIFNGNCHIISIILNKILVLQAQYHLILSWCLRNIVRSIEMYLLYHLMLGVIRYYVLGDTSIILMDIASIAIFSQYYSTQSWYHHCHTSLYFIDTLNILRIVSESLHDTIW